jgi:lysophospholipase L1-like esterase
MKRAALALVMLFLLVATLPGPVTIATPRPAAPYFQAGGINLSEIDFLGDGLTAGFQDGSLHASGQMSGFSRILLERVFPLPRGGDAYFHLPLIEEPGIPTPNAMENAGLLIQDPNMCTMFELATGKSMGLMDTSKRASNLAVPGHGMKDAVEAKWSIDPANPSTVDTAEDLILGFPYAFEAPPNNTPKSQMDTCSSNSPTIVFIWLGNNDVLKAALSGKVDDTTLTPVDVFNTAAETLFRTLGKTGAQGIILNIPDVTVFPFLISEPKLESLTGLKSSSITKLLGITKFDYVPVTALPTVKAIMSGQAARKLPSDMVLTKSELKKIQKRIKLFNQKLLDLTKLNNWQFLDASTLFSGFKTNGLDITGVGHVSTDYFGGFFSSDGIHPTKTGYAILASSIIETMRTLAPDIKKLDLMDAEFIDIATKDPALCLVREKQSPTLDDLLKIQPAARSAQLVITQGRSGL